MRQAVINFREPDDPLASEEVNDGVEFVQRTVSSFIVDCVWHGAFGCVATKTVLLLMLLFNYMYIIYRVVKADWKKFGGHAYSKQYSILKG